VIIMLAALVAVGWVSLWAWQQSSPGHGAGGPHGGSAVGGMSPTELPAFAAAWTLMVIAMMLPSAIPFVAEFDAVTARERQTWRSRLWPVVLLVAGYAAAWLLFGVAGNVGYWALGRLAVGVTGSQAGAGMLLQVALLVAGVYQFTPWKRRSLEGACSAESTMARHGHGGRRGSAAFVLGVRYGRECLGGCWALMLLMFALGTHDLALMLALGVVVTVEKNASWAAHLSRSLGGFLIGVALIMVLSAATGVSYVHTHV
jgi:predicted metal-binding membrane protein